ncbi:nucleoside-diphosphate kinase [Clostridium acetobutylicum]|uniref:Probable nucleoside-diphosphate kinase N-terminal domain n=1 Tax=Clostridium acetobutylicum (strain ATCC 824 / DSM 792 / JCM 1419 / IAM 19013 / LMG 5710 / NBRC 13948 / NRRL B-527 / VKM B-1787 / 2291 / W) TaxID=272562 RepID=Q97KC2_CLOAB|nr:MULTISPECIES: nucleoside-diphosphate kinase [Clostridium]AAK78973.1 Probable nucleoside-diphosphate kinase N-terminal domain [Clostridium acetobutylicum ATCC 824]ADZ20047.1 putative nucleoside-diphosphate kinase N-terminal domain protein [Clostridium acetobutylicum EA 2018]AEI31543.1 nucleoside-diphosphate kinase [Clostridium acetobutylicum DSM 1731]AWV81771.1 nucleoside kinase [Clostridium acetobutylicum]MBC2395314.1 nucleoside kinase [Clostridium acetobutylicum]
MRRVLLILKPTIVERKLIGKVLSFYEGSGFRIEDLKITKLYELENVINDDVMKKVGMNFGLENRVVIVVLLYDNFNLNFEELKSELKIYLNTINGNSEGNEIYMSYNEDVNEVIEVLFPKVSKFAFKGSKATSV